MKATIQLFVSQTKTTCAPVVTPAMVQLSQCSQTYSEVPGLALAAVPTCTKYGCKIAMMPSNDATDFRFSMTVGDKKININDGDDNIIYGPGGTIVYGPTGTTDDFTFVSRSPGSDTMRNPKKSNEIYITVQKLFRTPRQCPQPQVYRSLGSSGISGGETVSGGNMVPHLKTYRTTDTFDNVGDPVEMSIQLVNLQSDGEKNADNAKCSAYFQKNLSQRILDDTKQLNQWVAIAPHVSDGERQESAMMSF